MKHFLNTIVLVTLALFLSACEDLKPLIEDLDSRLTALEGTKIPSVDQQIQAIQTSIGELKEMDKTIKGYIDVLNQKDLPEFKEAIQQLQAKDQELEGKISELQKYVDMQIGAQKDWVTATFCTLEQYWDLVNQLAAIKTDLNTFEGTVNNKFNEVAGTITALESSLKAWVNEAFTKYYDIATIDAKLEAIGKAIDDGDKTNKAAIDELSARVDKALNEITISYHKAISEAIETNNGVINQKIAGEIETVNKRIDDELDALKKRIDNLEERVKVIEDYIDNQKNFSIDFDQPEGMVCYPGTKFYVHFTLSDSQLETTVECVPDPGWKAEVSMGKNKGDIKITAPSDGGDGKILVFANRSSWTIMRALYVQEGVLRVTDKTYKMPWQGGELKVTVTTNMAYELHYSETTGSWVSVAPDTKGDLREDVLTFQIAENGEDLPARDGIVMFKNAAGDVLESLVIHQDAQPTNDPIVFADPIAKYACVEKFDTNHDGEVSYAEAAAVTSLSGLFTNWNTVETFDEIMFFTGVTSTDGVLIGLKYLEHITIPDWITSLGTNCFDCCSSLKEVKLPIGITSIPDYCFRGCSALESLTIPTTVTSFGKYAFSGCSHLVSVIVPETMTSIPDGCFQNCTALTTIAWPQALTTIGNKAFEGCQFKNADYTLELPTTVTTIGRSAFGYLHHLIIPSISPVIISSNSFAADYTFLYVPANMVEMYKVRTNWSNYADYIKPISDFPFVPGESVDGTVGDAIDLGLSVKWASWNVGASAPEEYGAYFAWGETDAKWDYNWSTYTWCYGMSSTLTKYCPLSKTNYWDGTNSPDNKVTLDLEDDAANVNWGGTWRMPTVAEWTELRENCTWTWTSNYNNTGISGRIVTSIKLGYTDKSIFLPAAGYRSDSLLYYVGDYGLYWSSTLNTNAPDAAWYVSFLSGSVSMMIEGRYSGRSVRPVRD